MSELKFVREPKTVGIVAASFNGGQPRTGVEEGPRSLIENGLVKQLESLNWKVEFNQKFQDFEESRPTQEPLVGNLKNPVLVAKACESVAKQVAHFQKEGKLALTLGGDHSIGLGTVAGTALAWRGKKDVCLIWVDAHVDINTPDTTPTGNLHGCPVSWLIGISGNLPMFDYFKEPLIKPERLVYIGLRDVDSGEKRILKEHNIKAFSMHEVDRYGIGKVVEMALDHVNPNRDLPIHLSFDVDALDPTVAPSTGTPVRGGLTFREGHYICEAVYETGLLAAFDVMEVNPTLGKDPESKLQTVEIGCSLTRSALGETLL